MKKSLMELKGLALHIFWKHKGHGHKPKLCLLAYKCHSGIWWCDKVVLKTNVICRKLQEIIDTGYVLLIC